MQIKFDRKWQNIDVADYDLVVDKSPDSVRST